MLLSGILSKESIENIRINAKIKDTIEDRNATTSAARISSFSFTNIYFKLINLQMKTIQMIISQNFYFNILKILNSTDPKLDYKSEDENGKERGIYGYLADICIVKFDQSENYSNNAFLI